MKIKLGLLELVENFMEKIGVGKPKIITKTITNARHSIVLGFDGTCILYQLLSGATVLQQSFYEEDAVSEEMAEHKAVMQLMNHLKQHYGIEVHDTSHSKILACQEKCIEFVEEMDSFVGRFNVFLNKYENCMNDLDNIASVAADSHGNADMDIKTTVKEMVNASLTKVKDIKMRLITAGENGCGYTIGFSPIAVQDNLKGDSVVWTVSEKETLAVVLGLLGLPGAKYFNKMSDEVFFIGTCKVNIGQYFGSNLTGATKIDGDEKSTPYDAECSVAGKTITVLERIRQFEVVDLNYDNLIVQRQKLSSIVQHRSRLESLFFEANTAWSNLITNMEEFITAHYGLSQPFPSEGEESVQWSARMSCLNDLDGAMSSMKEVKYVAVSTMAAKI